MSGVGCRWVTGPIRQGDPFRLTAHILVGEQDRVRQDASASDVATLYQNDLIGGLWFSDTHANRDGCIVCFCGVGALEGSHLAVEENGTARTKVNELGYGECCCWEASLIFRL